MLSLLQLLIYGHLHKWKVLDRRDFYDRRDEAKPNKMPIGAVYIQQCEHCGKVIRRQLSA